MRSILIHNRTLARAEALAASYPQATAIDAPALEQALRTARLVVNATSIGMETNETAFDVRLLRSDAIVYDTVYVPLETAHLRAARAGGLIAVDGLGMLMHQARPGAKAWYGADIPPDSLLRGGLEQSLIGE